MKTNLLLALLLINSFLTYSQEERDHKKMINDVIVYFSESIHQKDSLQFSKLFFHDKVSFVGIMSKATEMSIKKNYPEFEGISVSNSAKFIREICLSQKEQSEKMYNIKIETGGIIASVSFDYSFTSGGKMFQWGNEKWNLVFADNQWLITDVIYSIHFPDIEKFPYGE